MPVSRSEDRVNSSPMSSPRILDTVLRAALEVTGGLDAWVAVTDDHGLAIRAVVGESTTGLAGLRLDGSTGSTANTSATGQPMAIRVRSDNIVDQRIVDRLGRRPGSILSVPCEDGDLAVGALEVVDSHTGAFSIDDVEVVTQLGAIVAAALAEDGHQPRSPSDGRDPRIEVLAGQLDRLHAVDPSEFDRIARAVEILLSR